MLTINYLKKNRIPLSHTLTDEDKKILLEENKDKDYSYLCLMREMFSYSMITVDELIRGWGGVTLVKL